MPVVVLFLISKENNATVLGMDMVYIIVINVSLYRAIKDLMAYLIDYLEEQRDDTDENDDRLKSSDR